MIENKTIWITGASSGIGATLALQLAATGNTVIASARSADQLQGLAARAKDYSGKILPFVCDVTLDEQTAGFRSQLLELTDHLDILIICAGRCEYIDDAELDVALFRRVYDVNVFGAVNAASVALPLLEEAAQKNQTGKPQIVAVASLSAVTGLPRAEAYGSSKAAMIYLFNTLRLDLQKRIDVTIVNPGFVETPMTRQNDFPMPFIMQPSAAAERIIKGIEKRKLTLNFPLRLWLSLKIPSLIPSVWYRYLGPKLARTERR